MEYHLLEAKRRAIVEGNFSDRGRPGLTCECDGAWSKRCNRNDYSAKCCALPLIEAGSKKKINL